MRYVIAIAALLLMLLAIDQAAASGPYPLSSSMRGGLDGFRLDVTVVSQPTEGGAELVIANNGDTGYVLIGCTFCTRWTRVSAFAHDVPADWPDNRILFGFKLATGETVKMFTPTSDALLKYEITIWMLDMNRSVIARMDGAAYDGESP